MSTTSTVTPEHLRHFELNVEPFTPEELTAIHAYENGTDNSDGAEFLAGLLDGAEFISGSPEVTDEEVDRAHILANFEWLSDWYQLLDSLKSDLRNPGDGPAHTEAAYRYLQRQCNRWYRTLHLVRREACRWAFGTAGPRPEVTGGYLTFFDIPGILLDGTIAAESDA